MTLTERQWQSQVCQLLDMYGWEWYHTHDSRRSPAGFPDLFCLHPHERRALALELKTDTGRCTAEQSRWLFLLQCCGIESHVMRPRQLDMLVRLLTRPGISLHRVT